MCKSADCFAERKGYFGLARPVAVIAFVMSIETVCSMYPSTGNRVTSYPNNTGITVKNRTGVHNG